MTDRLAHARYISLESFKKNGDGVRTPVWCAPLDDKIVVFTAGSSYKVKRIARNPQVRIARCDARGKLLGDFHPGTCEIVSDPNRERAAYKALRKKYGLQMRMLDFFSGLAGKKQQRKVLEIALAS